LGRGTQLEGETYPLGNRDSNGHKQQHITARSKHPGGVNAAKCDGSVAFYADNIDAYLWNSLTSAAGQEPLGAIN
jgi:prepilin-type processing-associated H-X9-DG protein